MPLIDNFLNRITMYRLVLYYVCVLLVAAFVFSFFHLLPTTPLNLLFSTLVILAVSWGTNVLFAKIYGAIPNVESVYITAFILALIITPVAPTNVPGIGFLVAVSILAMGSKYTFAFGKKHIFNPAAFGIAAGALIIGQSASWWVGGNLPLLPFVLIGGFLITRKIRRFDLVIAFSIVALATIALTSRAGSSLLMIEQTLLHTSFFFLALVMLTEPLTMPPSRWLRVAYASLVAFLFAPNIHLGSYYFTPEVALLVGNLFAYIVSPKGRFMLTLKEKKEIATDTYEFVFAPDRPIPFHAGQYIEWTLPAMTPDDRGNRRFFTLASAPTENVVRLGVRYSTPASTFKQSLASLRENDTITAAQIAGDFTLPTDAKKKLVWIAGGIGITPFRSQAQYLMDTNNKRDITLLYSNKTAPEIAYKDVFTAAQEKIGLRTIYALTNESAPVPNTHNGFIDAALIQKEIPDYTERIFYISGPHGMVEAFKKTLHAMGVSRFNIKADYFPGFA